MQSRFPNALVLCLDEFLTFFRLYPSHKCVTSIICVHTNIFVIGMNVLLKTLRIIALTDK